jgi:hypothetical protein
MKNYDLLFIIKCSYNMFVRIWQRGTSVAVIETFFCTRPGYFFVLFLPAARGGAGYSCDETWLLRSRNMYFDKTIMLQTSSKKSYFSTTLFLILTLVILECKATYLLVKLANDYDLGPPTVLKNTGVPIVQADSIFEANEASMRNMISDLPPAVTLGEVPNSSIIVVLYHIVRN